VNHGFSDRRSPEDPSYEVRIGAGNRLPAGAITEANPMLLVQYSEPQSRDLRVCGYVTFCAPHDPNGSWLPFTDETGHPNILLWDSGGCRPMFVLR